MLNPFDMNSHDDSSSLRLSMNVNNENFSSEKNYNNVTSLRVPADPSWPKIPSRRTTDNISDISEPACDIFMGGTPRRSRSITRPHSISSNVNEKNYQGSFFDYQCPKVSTQHYPPRRRPGCLDPRFKKVTSKKPQSTPVDPPPRYPSNSPESNSSGAPVSRNNYDSFRCEANPMKLKRIESIATQTAPGDDISPFERCEVELRDKNTMEIQSVELGDSRIIEKCEGEKDFKAPIPLSKLTIVSNASINVQSEPSSCECQGTNGVFMNTIPLPVVSYQISPQSQGKIELTPQLAIYYPQNLSGSQGKGSLDHCRVTIPHQLNSGDSEVPDSERITEDSASQCHKTPHLSRKNSNTKNNETMSAQTQELLTKNYWNYYRSLREGDGDDYRREIQSHERMGAPETKKRRSEEDNSGGLSPLELRTLEHCTVLSSMINNTRDQESPEMRELFGSKSGSFPGELNAQQPLKNQGSSRVDKSGNNSFIFASLGEDKSLGLCEKAEERKIPKVRTFVLCGIAIYFVIILLQAFYENVYYEDNDYYEELNYVEYFLNYAMLSFREAFRQTFDVMNSLLLQSVKLDLLFFYSFQQLIHHMR
ncbi:uncharacterized protein LOC107048000 [Diachasma alloeum]|uniref:uncharacterized protein LOC107048000 n=1 Tax=Diachasma alloeum TaxID=454923 RepID=UPI0007382864|nr:uncharacterized protein LOC107048000 [Diachasma alloeum]